MINRSSTSRNNNNGITVNADHAVLVPSSFSASASSPSKMKKKTMTQKQSICLYVLNITMILLCLFFILNGIILMHHYQYSNLSTTTTNSSSSFSSSSSSSTSTASTSTSTSTTTLTSSYMHHMLRNFVAGGDSSSSSSSRISSKVTTTTNINNNKELTATDKITTTDTMPEWIINYVKWHNNMRQQFPGSELITNINSPGVLVRWCGGLCGGLHDRLGQLPLDLYIANQTKRVLLIKWEKPHALEHFLIPPNSETSLRIDWTFPTGVPNWTRPNIDNPMKTNWMYPSISNIGGNRGDITFSKLIENAIDQYGPNSKDDNNKLVLLKVMGHLEETYLESQLQKLGEIDMIHKTKTFGIIWNIFFQLNPIIEKQLYQIMTQQLHIQPEQYTAVHCRVRHPKAFAKGTRIKGKGGRGTPDKTGLPFEAGPVRDFAVRTAIHAIKCSTTLLFQNTKTEVTTTTSSLQELASADVNNSNNYKNETIVFMSDSNDLVDFIVRNIKDDTYISQHPSMDMNDNSISNNNNVYKEVYELINEQMPNNIISRDTTINIHIDKQKDRPIKAYYGIFIDLYIAIYAKCVSYGVGFFAVFATKISGTECKVQYTKEEWGEQKTTSKTNNNICTPKDYEEYI